MTFAAMALALAAGAPALPKNVHLECSITTHVGDGELHSHLQISVNEAERTVRTTSVEYGWSTDSLSAALSPTEVTWTEGDASLPRRHTINRSTLVYHGSVAGGTEGAAYGQCAIAKPDLKRQF